MNETQEKKPGQNIGIVGIDIKINDVTVRLSVEGARALRDRLNEMLAPTPCKSQVYSSWWTPWHESAFTNGFKK